MNYVLIIFLLILLYCLINGARKGVIRIVFGLIAWAFVLWFINFSIPYISDAIYSNTTISQDIKDNIDEHLHETYSDSESEDEGSGNDAILALIPSSLQEMAQEQMQSSIDAAISVIAEELTTTAIQGIATLIGVIIAILIVFLVGKLVNLIGLIPGLKEVNRFFGAFAGLLEAALIIWFILYIADCFPTSAFGEFILNGVNGDEMLTYIYDHNLIKTIVGI